MAFDRLRRLVSGEARGLHFAAVLFMGPLAAVAILGLREVHLVAPTPIWLIPLILVGGQLICTTAGMWRHRFPESCPLARLGRVANDPRDSNDLRDGLGTSTRDRARSRWPRSHGGDGQVIGARGPGMDLVVSGGR